MSPRWTSSLFSGALLLLLGACQEVALRPYEPHDASVEFDAAGATTLLVFGDGFDRYEGLFLDAIINEPFYYSVARVTEGRFLLSFEELPLDLVGTTVELDAFFDEDNDGLCGPLDDPGVFRVIINFDGSLMRAEASPAEWERRELCADAFAAP